MNYTENERDLQRIIMKMLLDSRYMFYGFFLSEVNKGFTTVIDTACLGKHPSAPIPFMWFNPDFWNALKTDEEKMFLVTHEVHHLIDMSWIYSREFGMEQPLDNIAMDLGINSRIQRDHPELQFPKDEKGNNNGLLPSTFPELKLESCRESLYYYNIIRKAKDKKDEGKGKEDSKAGPKGNKNGSSGSKALDGMLDRNDYDKHPLWGELTRGLSDLEKEIFKRDLLNRIEKIVEDVERCRGTVPLDLQGIKSKVDKIKPTVSWKSVFRNFIGSTFSQDQYATYKKQNFRFPESKGYKYKTKTKVVVLFDSLKILLNIHCKGCQYRLSLQYEKTC